MKGIFFCALIELKRRIPDFIAFGIIIWAELFTAVSFLGVINMFARVADKSAAALVFMIAAAVIILLLDVCGYMVMTDRFKRRSREYSALRNCGMSEGGFCAVQIIQTLIILSADLTCAIPLALAAVWVIAGRYNRRISGYEWIYEIDWLVSAGKLEWVEAGMPIIGVIAVTLLICGAALLTAVLACLAFSRGKALDDLSRLRSCSGRISCQGELLRENDFKHYIRVTAKRLGRVMSRANAALCICFLLPFLLIMLSTSFAPAESSIDYVISTETMRNPIPGSLADELERIDGVKITRRSDGTEVYERLTGTKADEEKYSFIHFCIDSDRLVTVIDEIGKKIENRGFEFSAPFISRQITNVKYSLLREYFIMLAGVILICWIFAAAAVMGDYFRYRSREVNLLAGLGVDSFNINMLRFVSGLRLIFSDCLISAVIGCAIYAPFAIAGGDKQLAGMLEGLIIGLTASLLISGLISLLYTIAGRQKERGL